MAIVAIGGFYGLLRICDFGAASRNGWIVIQARVYYDAKRIAGKSLTEQQLSNAIAGIKLKWPITEFEPHITYFNETNWMVRLIPTKPNPLNWSILLEPTLWNYSRAQFSTIEIRSNGSAQQGSGAYVDPRRVNEAHR